MTGPRGFFESEDAYVRRATNEAVAAAAGADSRLMRLIRATDERITALTARVEGLSQAFDAFVELSDVRREAEQYGAAAAVRAFVRGEVSALTSASEPVPSVAGVADVPDYWLPPAVRGLVGLLTSDGEHDAGAKEHLAEASRRDAHRTAVFLVSVLGARGAGDKAEPWLRAALPALGGSSDVTLAARCLWLAYGEGVYGPAGRAVLSEWLAELASSVGTKDLEQGLGTLGGPPEGLFTPAEASRLRNLRSQAIESSLLAAATARASLATLLDVLNGTARPASAAEAPAAPVPNAETMLVALVEEGSGPEAELMAKAEALEARARRAARREAPAKPLAWDASVGRAADLLFADLFDASEAAAARRAAALSALGRPLANLADVLLARTAELPDAFPVTVAWQHTVTLSHTTPFEETLAAAHAEIDRTVAAETGNAKRKQAEERRRRGEEQKQQATERLRAAADVLAAYRGHGAEIHAAAKASHAGVMEVLVRHSGI